MYKIIVGKLVSFDPIIKLSIITQLLITYALVINFLNNWLKIHNWLVLKSNHLLDDFIITEGRLLKKK
jgi:hypothetical protein